MTSEEARKFSQSLELYKTRVRITLGTAAVEGVINSIGLHGKKECVWIEGFRKPFCLVDPGLTIEKLT